MTRSMHRVIEIPGDGWETPLTRAPDRRVGDAQIRHSSYPRGYFRMEGFLGSELYQVTRTRLPVTELQRRHRVGGRKEWKTWMVDDPLHWLGMEATVKALPPGRVVVAGLGLGLMLHHMARRSDLTEITVVEIDPDVIELIRPTLPSDPRVAIVCQDYYRYIEKSERPDSVLWDLAVGHEDETVHDMLRGEVLTEMFYGQDIPLFQFGRRQTKRPDWMKDINFNDAGGPQGAYIPSAGEGQADGAERSPEGHPEGAPVQIALPAHRPRRGARADADGAHPADGAGR